MSGVPLVIKRTAAKEDLTPDPILGKLAQKGIRLHVAMCCDSGWGVKAAVKEGIGVGLICREAVAMDDRRGDLKIIKISDLNMEIDSYIVFHRERPLSPPAQSLLAFLRQWQQKTDCGVKRLSLA